VGDVTEPGPVIVLNGVPRSGKSSIALEIANRADGWVNLGVDSVMRSTAADLQPGIGLRPGGERPDLEPFIRESYRSLFDDVVTASRSGSSVVVDVGIHDSYSRSLGIWAQMRERFAGVELILVGVHCSLPVLRRRRAAGGYLTWERGQAVPAPVLRWQEAVHHDKTYDIDVDTSTQSAPECAHQINLVANLER